ncbi:OmpA family protein, partial [bacterium]|nr:OmpA family protein [bacterium]
LGVTTPLAEEADSLPSQFQSAAMYQFPDYGQIRPRLTAAASLDGDKQFQGALGSEIELFNHLILRSGCYFQPDMNEKWSFGLGFSYVPFRIDYGMLPLPELDLVHLVSLQYSFIGNRGNPSARVKVLARLDRENRFVQQFDLEATSHAPLRKWRFKIMDENGLVLKRWQGKNSPPEQLIWDMTDIAGQPLANDQGTWYQFRIEDEAYRAGMVSGRLLSKQTALAPKLHQPAAQTQTTETILSFNVQQVKKHFQPRMYKLEFASPDGKIIKQYSQMATDIRELNSLLARDKAQRKLPAGFAGYKLTFIGKHDQKQEISSSLVSMQPGLLIALQGYLLDIPLTLSLRHDNSNFQSWKMEIQNTPTGAKMKSFQGRGRLPQHLEWTPEKSHVRVKAEDQYQADLVIQDKNGVAWRQIIPIVLVRVKDKSTGPEESKLEINQILFNYNEYYLKKAALHKLQAAAMIMRHYPVSGVVIKGHTDEIGSKQYNLKLSRQRAASVQRYLVEEEEFKEKLFRIKGYGFLKPYVTSRDEESRRKNRQVEIVITYPEKKK